MVLKLEGNIVEIVYIKYKGYLRKGVGREVNRRQNIKKKVYFNMYFVVLRR